MPVIASSARPVNVPAFEELLCSKGNFASGSGLVKSVSEGNLSGNHAGVFMISSECVPLSCCPGAEKLLADGTHVGVDGNGRMTLLQRDHDKRLRSFVTNLSSDDGGKFCKFVVPRTDYASSTIVSMYILMAKFAGVDHRGVIEKRKKPLCVVQITPLENHRSPDMDSFVSIFRLTPREKQLALDFFNGLSISEASEKYRLSLNTIRDRTKRIYQKTNTNGMASLMRLMFRFSV